MILVPSSSAQTEAISAAAGRATTKRQNARTEARFTGRRSRNGYSKVIESLPVTAGSGSHTHWTSTVTEMLPLLVAVTW